MRRTDCLLALLCLLALSPFGCGDSPRAPLPGPVSRSSSTSSQMQDLKPAYGDMLVMGSIKDVSVLIPALATDIPSRKITQLIYNGLVKYDRNVNLVGDLAERWEISKDQKTIRFFLRKGVRWHDGRSFSSRDVEFTYRVYIDPKTPTPYASDFLRIKELRIIDDYTLDVEYAKPYAPALASWTEGMLPRHLLEGVDITESPLQRAPIGTGPFRFVSWVEGEKIVLEANPHYFRGRPRLNRVMIRSVLDKATAFLELKAGNLDLAYITPLQYKRQTSSEWFAETFNRYKYLSFSYNYLAYNLRDYKFRDPKVRTALTMAIDRKGIVRGVLLGLGQVAHGPYHPNTYWYNAKVPQIEYNPKKAAKLLAQAGWKDSDGDGILDKEGTPFEFTILTNQGDDNRARAAAIIQYNLGKIGIAVEVRVMEWAALLHNFLYKRNFESCLIGCGLDYDPNQYDKWHSSKTGPHDSNWMSYQNKEVDELLELGGATYDKRMRKKYYDKIQEILAKDQPCAFLWVQDTLAVVHSRFQAISPTPMGIEYNLDEWYVPAPLQKYRVPLGEAGASNATADPTTTQ